MSSENTLRSLWGCCKPAAVVAGVLLFAWSVSATAQVQVFGATFEGGLGSWAITDVSGSSGEWTTTTYTVNPSNQPPHSGAFMARFNSYNAEAGNSTRLWWPNMMDLGGFHSLTLSFWMYHDTEYSDTQDRVQVQVSTNGTNWINVGGAVNRYSGATGWAQHIVNLSAYDDSAAITIGFLGISQTGNDIYLDDVVLSGSPGCLVSPAYGAIGTTLVITGNSFGALKGKVALLPSSSVEKPPAVKVLTWTDSEITAVLSKATEPCDCTVQVLLPGKEPTIISSVNEFSIRVPYIQSVDPAFAPATEPVTVYGDCFGTKKATVTMKVWSSDDKPLKCKVLSLDDTTVVFLPAKKAAPGLYSVKVENSVGSCTLVDCLEVAAPVIIRP